MMAQVILDERRDEVIAVVVTGLAPERQWIAAVLASLFQAIRHQLRLEERIGETLIDEERRPSVHVGQRAEEFAGVVRAPAFAVRPQVAAECFLSPGAMHRREDRRERGDRTKALRMTQAERQGAVAAHRMAEDALPARIYREIPLDERRQLPRDPAVHAVVARPGFFGRIHVETRGDAEVPVVAVARQRYAAWARVRRDQGEAEFRGHALRAGLDHE